MRKLNWKYVKELKDSSSIDKFEKKHGFSYPKDLKSVLLSCNGGRPELKYYDTASEKDKEFKTLLSFNESDIETVYKSYPLDSSDKTLIPFASDPAGNFFVLKNNEIHLWKHEVDKTLFLASTFSDFLEMLHE